jgi:cytochrome c
MEPITMKKSMKNWTLTSMLVFAMMTNLDNAKAAESAEPLAKANNCLLCHSVDAKIVGPAYKDVAKKYKGDKTAEARLIAKVKAGGSGVWGDAAMPPNSPQVKDEDIKTIVKWVLSL